MSRFQQLQELAPIVLLDEAKLGSSRKTPAGAQPTKASQTAETRHSQAVDECQSHSARRHAIGSVVDRMHGQSSTYSSRGIFPVNVNSLRARGAARVAIKNVFGHTARREGRSQSGGGSTAVRATPEGLLELPLGDLHQLNAEVPPPFGRLAGLGVARCSGGASMKRSSTRGSTRHNREVQIPRSSIGGNMLATGPQSMYRDSTATSTPHDASSLMMSAPSAATPQSIAQQARSGRGGSPNSRGSQKLRQNRVSIMGYGGTGSRKGISVRPEPQWYPQSAALQQELAQRGAEHVERYRKHILEAMSPAALLQELGLGQSTSLQSKCDSDVDLSENVERDSLGDLATQSMELARMLESAREALASATASFREHGAMVGQRPILSVAAANSNSNSPSFQALQQMFAPGEPSSKQRTIILIQMVKDTTDAVNEQLASLAGRRRRGFRNAGRALSSVASFSSRRGQAAEAALLAVTATVKIPEASENIWDLGIGVLPSTSTTSIRAATRLRGPETSSSIGDMHADCSNSGSNTSSHVNTILNQGLSKPRADTVGAARVNRVAAFESTAFNPTRRQQTMERTKGGHQADGKGKGEIGSEDSSDSESENVEGVDQLPSAMDLLRCEGMVVKEPRVSTALVSSKRVAKELRALLGTLDNLTPQDFVNARGPPLPPPPQDVAGDAVTCMQWRVQRIWTTLQVPPLQRLEMLTEFADKGFGEEMGEVVDAWEDAIAAAAAREGILVELAGINSEANKEDPCVTKIKDCVAKSRALLAATENVEEAAQQLLTVTGTDLTLAGQAYPPPGALRRAALSDFCTRILLRSSELA